MKLKLFVVALLVVVFGLLSSSVGPRGAFAQFPFLVNVTISVLPPQPVEGQEISIRLAMSGTWRDACIPQPPQAATVRETVRGNVIVLETGRFPPGLCAQVVTPFGWATTVPVGKLPAGVYFIRVVYGGQLHEGQLLGIGFFRVQALVVQEAALIHSEGGAFPGILTVRRGERVRLFHTALEGKHDPVVISRDPDGKEPVFGVEPFRVEAGQITVIEFTPDQVGEFFITHRRHGHDVVSRLVVKEP